VWVLRYLAQIRLDHDASGKEPSTVCPDDQEAELQDAELQEAELQEAELQEAELHEAELHEAEFQEAFAWAPLDQLAASKLRPPLGSLTM
jgi:uncharacterized protein YjbI with pentapeptide repeats